MNLNYPVEIQKIEENEGGGYTASINMLGKYAFRGDGETIEEALEDLKEATELYLEEFPMTTDSKPIITTFEITPKGADRTAKV